MKFLKSYFALILMLVSLSLYASPPTKDTRTVVLNKVFKGTCPSALQNVAMTVAYDYDFSKSYGMAKTLSVGGLSNQYTFMSDTKPIEATVNGVNTYIYQVVFTIYDDGKVDGLLMFGKDGGCTITSKLD